MRFQGRKHHESPLGLPTKQSLPHPPQGHFYIPHWEQGRKLCSIPLNGVDSAPNIEIVGLGLQNESGAISYKKESSLWIVNTICKLGQIRSTCGPRPMGPCGFKVQIDSRARNCRAISLFSFVLKKY